MQPLEGIIYIVLLLVIKIKTIYKCTVCRGCFHWLCSAFPLPGLGEQDLEDSVSFSCRSLLAVCIFIEMDARQVQPTIIECQKPMIYVFSPCIY